MKILFAASIVGMLLACAEEDVKTIDMRVNHFRQTAIGEGQLLVYLVQEEENVGQEDWSYFYGDIAGFTYEPGYTYDLSVEKTPVSDPPADAPSIRYVLKKLIAKKAVNDTVSFEVRLKSVTRSNPPSFVTGSLASGFELLATLPIDCNTRCDELDRQLATKDEVIGIFTHAPAGAIRLIGLENK
jgi:hypothetical protein